MILPMEIEIDKGIAKYNEIQRNRGERVYMWALRLQYRYRERGSQCITITIKTIAIARFTTIATALDKAIETVMGAVVAPGCSLHSLFSLYVDPQHTTTTYPHRPLRI